MASIIDLIPVPQWYPFRDYNAHKLNMLGVALNLVLMFLPRVALFLACLAGVGFTSGFMSVYKRVFNIEYNYDSIVVYSMYSLIKLFVRTSLIAFGFYPLNIIKTD